MAAIHRVLKFVVICSNIDVQLWELVRRISRYIFRLIWKIAFSEKKKNQKCIKQDKINQSLNRTMKS